MPKNYNDIYASVYETGNKMDFTNSIIRGNGIPLDIYSVFDSFNAAVDYAANKAVAYEGQIIAVTENGDTTVYVITPASQGTTKINDVDTAIYLKKVGTVPVSGDGINVTEDGVVSVLVDGTTIKIVDGKLVAELPATDNVSVEVVNNKIRVHDFGKQYYKYVPAVKDEETGEETTPSTYELTEGFIAGLEPRVRLNTDGDLEIGWYEPSSETVEGVNSKVETVTESVSTIENILNGDGTEENVGIVKEVDVLQETVVVVEEQVEALEEKVGTASTTDAAATGLYLAVDELTEQVETYKTETDEAIENLQTAVADRYTKAETDSAISTAIAAADHLKRTIVDSVDAIDETAADADEYIYMVKNGDKYDEYMVVNGAVEKVGDWDVDLSNYYTKSEVDAAIDADVKVVADDLGELESTVADNKEELEGKIALKADASALADYAKTTEVDTKLADYAKTADVNTELAKKADASLADTVSAQGEDIAEIQEALATKADADRVGTLEGTVGTLSTQVETNKNDIASLEENKADKTALDDYTNTEALTALLAGKADSSVVEGNADDILALTTRVGEAELDIASNTTSIGNLTTRLDGIVAQGGEPNLINSIKAAGYVLPIGEDKSVDMPIATDAIAGLIKSSTAENAILVGENGVAVVNSLNVNKLVQTEGDTLILNGGSSAN